MIRRLLALGALAAAGSLVFAGVSSSKVILKCKPNEKPGTEVVQGRTIRIYCGTAKGTLRQQGKTYHFAPGLCITYPNVLVLALGKETRTTPGKGPLYMSMFSSLPAIKDGTFRNAFMRYQLPGKEVSLRLTVVLRAGRTKATFTGRVQSTNTGTVGPKVSGSFSCK